MSCGTSDALRSRASALRLLAAGRRADLVSPYGRARAASRGSRVSLRVDLRSFLLLVRAFRGRLRADRITRAVDRPRRACRAHRTRADWVARAVLSLSPPGARGEDGNDD